MNKDEVFLTESRLSELMQMADASTPRPWYVVECGDKYSASMICISTKPQSDPNAEPNPQNIVAAALVQNPRYVDVEDEKWDANAQYLATAANVLPHLIAEILELRAKLKAAQSQ